MGRLTARRASICLLLTRAASSTCYEAARLKAIARAARDGAVTTGLEEQQIAAIGGEHAAIYGEITPPGFAKLARRMDLGPEDHFADLGSGLGRCTIQAVSEFHAASACGIELAASRHRLAVAALAREEAAISKRVRFLQGDCADESLWAPDVGPLSSVTCLYVSSLLFSSDLMERVGTRIRAASSVRCVASLKRFPEGALGNAFVETPPEHCETSWTASMLVVADASGVDPEPDKHPGSPLYIYSSETSRE